MAAVVNECGWWRQEWVMSFWFDSGFSSGFRSRVMLVWRVVENLVATLHIVECQCQTIHTYKWGTSTLDGTNLTRSGDTNRWNRFLDMNAKHKYFSSTFQGSFQHLQLWFKFWIFVDFDLVFDLELNLFDLDLGILMCWRRYIRQNLAYRPQCFRINVLCTKTPKEISHIQANFDLDSQMEENALPVLKN